MSSDTTRDDAQGEEPPWGTERWKQETKGIERIIDVTLASNEPRTAGWIAEEALVSEQTTREHLELLADLGVVAATTTRGVTKYRPDATWMRFQRVSAMVERYDRDELLDQVEAAKERINEAEQRYEVDTPDELRAKAASPSTTSEQVEDFRKVAAEWDAILDELDAVQEALERYEEYDQTAVSV